MVTKCQDCDSPKLLRDYERHELVCQNCGLVQKGGDEMDKKKVVDGKVFDCDLCGDGLPSVSMRGEGVSLVCPKCVAVLQTVKKMTDEAARAAEDNIKQEVKDILEELDDNLCECRSRLADLERLVE